MPRYGNSNVSGSGLPARGVETPATESATQPAKAPQAMEGNYAPWGTQYTGDDLAKTYRWYKAQFGNEFGDEGSLRQSFLDDWTKHPDYMRSALGMAQAGEVDSILGGQMQQNVAQQPVPVQPSKPSYQDTSPGVTNIYGHGNWVPGITDTPWAHSQIDISKWGGKPGSSVGQGGDVPMQSDLGLNDPDPTVGMLRDQTHTPMWGATWSPPGGDPNQHQVIPGKAF